MISKKHFTKSIATIFSTLTFLTAVSPCTFAEKNANVNATGNDGVTPLHIAAHWGYKEVCELLLKKCADKDTIVNATDNDGRTPLDVASTDEIKQLLCNNGAKYGSELND